jgi:hypothetical protein
MNAVKEYWNDKIFVLGIFFCIIGTILGAFGVVTPAVFVEIIGILLILYVIYKIDKKETT